jgi:hypothetical protein
VGLVQDFPSAFFGLGLSFSGQKKRGPSRVNQTQVTKRERKAFRPTQYRWLWSATIWFIKRGGGIDMLGFLLRLWRALCPELFMMEQMLSPFDISPALWEGLCEPQASRGLTDGSIT